MNEVSRPWTKYYDSQASANYEPPVMAIPELLRQAAQKDPNRKAVVFQNWSMTYGEFDRLAGVMAANLRAMGLRPGARVAVLLPNLPQTLITYYAVLKAGGVLVMMNPLYMEKELYDQLADSGAEFMVTLDLLWSKIEGLRRKVQLRKIVVTSIADALGFPLRQLYKVKAWKQRTGTDVPYGDENVVKWKQIVQGRETYSHVYSDPHHDVAMLQYTGGTTGVPKGVMLSHYNLTADVQQCLAMLPKLKTQQHTLLAVLPFFHIFGLTVCMNLSVALAATIIPFPRLVVDDLLKAIQKYKPTIFPAVPAIFVAMIQHKKLAQYKLSSIDYCISGSAPLPVEVMNKFESITGAEIIEGYGLTEAAPVTHLNPLDGQRKPGSIGIPSPGTDAAIVDMEGGAVPVPPGKMGELVVRGPQVMLGYWNCPDETACTVRNTWLYTGDIATMDEDGFFFIVDRKKDLIISGGYNIYPRDVDEVLYQHPKVKEAVAVGIPHPTRGEIVKAYIVPKDGESIEQSEIIEFCSQKLAKYKVPRRVEFRTELPKTLVGKVLRRALQQEEMEKAQCRRKGGDRRAKE
ncbi:long-chain acyl-CoA synthetase [Desulfonatronum thiosulfatophilum]|uniref:Long-chain acyl-CoA synthetase n=1 Tax=Desulfonatronum thiosulfatophilum TaxID=617002 RepID=A0A1G6A177_9BACT|nr:long-chain fatty acid--CoA ligase [Desulfonatronum thiosulfatophilum]SDB02175.1 long-chain acyl-CoA synthetase [Desulfonatronum thiosulfatophilum]